MPAKIAQLEIDFITNLAKFTDDLRSSEREAVKTAKAIQNTMTRAWQGIAVAGVSIGIGSVFNELISNADEAQSSMAQVAASLKSTGGVAGVTSGQVEDLAQQIKKLTALDDDAVRSMEGVLLTFTKVGKEVFPQAAQAIVDLSVKMKQDLQSSAVQVGKALNDPIKGLTALQRVGVSFSESQKAVVKNLVETGRAVDAQKIILRELQTEFGGSAAAARDTLGGALQALQVRCGDVYQAIAGDAGSVRYGIEQLITIADSASASITDFQKSFDKKAPNEFSQALDYLGQMASAIGNIIKADVNAIVEFGVVAGSMLSEVGKSFTEFQQSKLGMFLMPTAGLGKQIGEQWGKLFNNGLKTMSTESGSKSITDAVSNLFGGSGKDYVGQIFKPLSDQWKSWEDETTKRIKSIHDRAAGALPKIAVPDADGGIDKKAAKKAAAELEHQEKSLKSILHEYAKQAQGVGEVTAQQKILNEQMEAEYKISGLLAVPLRERLAAINEIATVTKQKLEAERLSGIAKERTALQGLLSDMQEQLSASKEKNDDQEELIPLLRAEAKIRELMKNYSSENLDLAQKIRDVAKDQSNEIINERHERALKTVQEITTEYENQYSDLVRSIDGQDKLNKLLLDEKRIRETKGLTDQEKDDKVRQIQQQDAKTKALNKTLTAHKKVIDDITGSGLSQKKQIEALKKAYENGDISAKEWADTMNDISKNSNKAQSAASGFASSLIDGFGKIMSGGAKVSSVIKDIGKDLLKVFSDTLFKDPLQKAITKLLTSMFSGGVKVPVTPVWMPPGVSYNTNPYTGLPQYSGGAPTNPNSVLGAAPAAGSQGGSTSGGTYPALPSAGAPTSGPAYFGNAKGPYGANNPSPATGLAGGAWNPTVPAQPAGLNLPGPAGAIVNALNRLSMKLTGSSVTQTLQKHPIIGAAAGTIGGIGAAAQTMLTGGGIGGAMQALSGIPWALKTMGWQGFKGGTAAPNAAGPTSGGNGAIDRLIQAMQDMMHRAGDFFGKFKDAFREGISSLVGKVGGLFTGGLSTALKNLFNGGGGGSGGSLLNMVAGPGGGGSGGGILSAIGGGLKTAGSATWEFLKKILPGFAGGGYYDGGAAIVGERGPEAIFSDYGGYVATNNQLRQMSSYAQNFYDLASGNANFGDNTGAWMANNKKASEAFDAWRAYQAGQGYQLQMRDLWEQSQMIAADDMTRRTAGTADQNSKGAMWAQSIRSKENFGMWGGGAYGWASGNQSVAELQKLQAMGVSIPDNFWGEAIGQDAVWNLDGDKYSTKGVGFLAQKSMQMGGGQYTGNTDLIAYGGSAFNDNGSWNANSGANYYEPGNTYDVRQMMRAPGNLPGAPMGTYMGPKGDGKYVHQYGDPRKDTGNNNNWQWIPPFLTPKGGDTQTNKPTGNGSYRYDDYQSWYKSMGYDYTPKQSKFDMNNSKYIDRSATLKTPTAADMERRGYGSGTLTFPAMNQPFAIATSDTVFDQQFKSPKYTPSQMHANRSSSFDHYPTGPMEAGQIAAQMRYGGARAQGGRVEKNTLYKVLERGDEMFVPDSGGRIVPMSGKGAAANGGIAGGNDGGTINVFNHAGVETEIVRTGRDVNFYARNTAARDMISGPSAKALESRYGIKAQPPRR